MLIILMDIENTWQFWALIAVTILVLVSAIIGLYIGIRALYSWLRRKTWR